MFSYLMNDEKCPGCGLDLIGEDTIRILRVEGDVASVNAGGRLVESINMNDDADLILDIKYPVVVCSACGAALDISYNDEGS
jgi:hypothetical protein